MPYAKRRTFRKGSLAARGAARRYGTAAHGFQRTAMRRMQGPPAALYPRMPTNALAIKSVDATSSGAIQSTTAPTVLVVPRLGSAFFNRLSNRTRGVSLQLTGLIIPTYSNAAAIAEDFIRIIIYYDRQPNGANPSIADIVTNTDATGAATTTNYGFINMNNRDRFMILRDRRVATPQLAINGVSDTPSSLVTDLNVNGGKGFNYQEFIKLKGLESLYNSTNGGTVGDISAGAFGILIFNNDASGSPGWGFKLNVRFKFLD